MFRRTKKRFLRRKFRKFHKSRRASVRTFPVPGIIVPDRLRMKLWFDYTASVAQPAQFVQWKFSGNNLYDPLANTSNKSATGLAQWSAFFNNYRTFGSKIRVTFNNTSSAQTVVIGVNPTATSGGFPTSIQDMIDRPYSKYKYLGTSGGQQKGTITSYMSSAKIFGNKNVAVGIRPGYDFPTTQNPDATKALSWAWAVSIGTLDGTTNVSAQLVGRITFYVEFFNRKGITASAPLDDVGDGIIADDSNTNLFPTGATGGFTGPVYNPEYPPA